MKHVKEIIAEAIFLISALASIFAVAMICFFLFANGLPAIFKIGPLKFLTGTIWKPGNDIYGIFPMILGSIYVTAGAILIGVPIGILTAIYLSRFCPRGIYHVIKPAIDLLAGIPSVVYGFFGMVVIVPAMDKIEPAVMVTHVGGIDSIAETTLNLPKIPGGKKLSYTQFNMPMTAIEDFGKLVETDPFFKKLDEICKANRGLWSAEAERVLFDHFGVEY